MKYKRGFTLVELLVVVAIIGVLASIIVSSLNEARMKARDVRREMDIKTIQTALEIYYLDNGEYPEFSFRFSSSPSSWAVLETALGVTLPVDPINENIVAYTGSSDPDGGGLSYAYYSNPPQNCNRQGYMLLYNKETSNGVGSDDGVQLCNNFYSYNNVFVVGMDRNGVLRFN